MGYHTHFTGHITIDPPLHEAMVDELNTFCRQRHERTAVHERGHTYYEEAGPSVWCDLTFHTDRFEWSGKDKTYELDMWVKLVVDLLSELGHTCSGMLEAQGEDYDDVWRVTVNGTDVKRQEATVQYHFAPSPLRSPRWSLEQDPETASVGLVELDRDLSRRTIAEQPEPDDNPY